MKNRNVPFGYRYAKGVVVIDSAEAETVKAICSAYLSGQSLLTIANQLKELIIIADDDLLMRITETLNTMIADSTQIRLPEKTERQPDIAVMKLENEISRALETVGFDKETLRQKMLRCVSLKYQNIDHDAYAIQKMKADFERSSPLVSFFADLMAKTVKSITLNTDGMVCLTLINDQIIGKELTGHANSNPNDAA